jgi:hypothetical protein
MQNMTCAIRIVQNPGWIHVMFRNNVNSEAPRTISGVESGRKMRRFVEARDQTDLEREHDRVADPGHRVPVPPVVEGEAVPGVVEAACRVVEREGDHDRDRQQQVREGEEGVRAEQVAADEGHQTPIRSVPRARV